jgi:hypothetical protein
LPSLAYRAYQELSTMTRRTYARDPYSSAVPRDRSAGGANHPPARLWGLNQASSSCFSQLLAAGPEAAIQNQIMLKAWAYAEYICSCLPDDIRRGRFVSKISAVVSTLFFANPSHRSTAGMPTSENKASRESGEARRPALAWARFRVCGAPCLVSTSALQTTNGSTTCLWKNWAQMVV